MPQLKREDRHARLFRVGRQTNTSKYDQTHTAADLQHGRFHSIFAHDNIQHDIYSWLKDVTLTWRANINTNMVLFDLILHTYMFVNL